MTVRAAYLGIDAGTSSCKAVALTANQRVLCSATAMYATRRTVAGEVSQDANDWLRAIVSVSRTCARVTEDAGHQVAALAVTGPAHNVVLVGGNGEPLRRVLLWSDARPRATAGRLTRSLGQTVSDRTFARLDASWSLAQLAWLRTDDPDVWPNIHLVLPGKDYLRYRLTGGTVASDPSDATGTAMFDPVEGTWVPELCGEVGIREGQLPPIKPATASGGRLIAAMAHRMGLRPGVPVAVGATDTAAELVSVGAIQPGTSLVKIASTGTVVAVSGEPKRSQTLLTYPHAQPGIWYSLAATNSAATAYQWLRETVFAHSSVPPEKIYVEMDRVASRAPAGSDGVIFLPFLDGERTPFWDRTMKAAFLGLSSAHTREHLCRAVLEGVAISLRHCRNEVIEAGLSVDNPRLTGGGMASRLWRRILVSALGSDGFLPSPQGPAVGAALIAAASEESTGDRAAPLVAGRPRLRRIPPNEDWTPVYGHLARTYLEAARSLQRLPATLQTTYARRP